jgi:hypothetical protein
LSLTVAQASPYDFKLAQLGNPTVGGAVYSASANANFQAFAKELGAALTSANLMPPSTLGYNGFAVTSELSILNLQTQQFIFPTEGTFSGPLLLPSLHVRKGLPYSFEIGARAGWIQKSGQAAATLELKWAINEGFPHFPDIGIRSFLTRLFNARDLNLYAVGVDLGVGKRFAVAGMMTLTPYAGWNLVFVGASSNTVDFNPGRPYVDSVSTPTAQLQDTGVYREVSASSNSHNRLYLGLRFMAGALELGGEFSYSTLGQIRDAGTGSDRSLPSLWAISTSVGLDL